MPTSGANRGATETARTVKGVIHFGDIDRGSEAIIVRTAADVELGHAADHADHVAHGHGRVGRRAGEDEQGVRGGGVAVVAIALSWKSAA